MCSLSLSQVNTQAVTSNFDLSDKDRQLLSDILVHEFANRLTPIGFLEFHDCGSQGFANVCNSYSKLRKSLSEKFESTSLLSLTLELQSELKLLEMKTKNYRQNPPPGKLCSEEEQQEFSRIIEKIQIGLHFTDCLVRLFKKTKFEPQLCSLSLPELTELMSIKNSYNETVIDPQKLEQLAQKIDTDPFILHIIMRNILSNAVQAQKIGKKTTVSINISFSTTHAILTCRDNGKGMNPFQRHLANSGTLRSSKKNSTSERHGLGIPICLRLAALLGGELRYEADIEKGTQELSAQDRMCIKLTLPLNTQDLSDQDFQQVRIA